MNRTHVALIRRPLIAAAVFGHPCNIGHTGRGDVNHDDLSP